MTIPKHPKNNPVHYPEDRRLRLWVRPSWLVGALMVALLPLAVAWVQYLVWGLPEMAHHLPSHAQIAPQGFPLWLRVAHYVNFVLIILLFRSGLSILMDHPRLYWNDHCTPGSEWLRWTPLGFPTDRVWQAKDDARYISPWLALPGYRHTIGMARHWHLLCALAWFFNGLIFIALLYTSGQWPRLVPESWNVIPDAWAVFVHYATGTSFEEVSGFYHYNPLQQLGYFAVVFLMAPLTALTGFAMSPALESRFAWYPKLFGGRQAARSWHFILAAGYIGFLVVHIILVAATGLFRNMNNIVLGIDSEAKTGFWGGLLGVAGVVGICVIAHHVAWKLPRLLQRLVHHIHALIRQLFFKHFRPRVQYSKEDISPFLWPNGKMPTSQSWQDLANNQFMNFKLKIHGLVDNPVELSLQDLRKLKKEEQITMHHCIQGWSGIAHWAGVPLASLVEIVKPRPEAGVVVFHSFGEGLYGGAYYDTQTLENVLEDQCLLAYDMNEAPLPDLYGAPLRLRVENQLGYKMVKWIDSIEFVASEKDVGKGYGGKNEDDEYFDLIPEI